MDYSVDKSVSKNGMYRKVGKSTRIAACWDEEQKATLGPQL